MTVMETKKHTLLSPVDPSDHKSWTVVEINDQFYNHWHWGKGPYYDWCDENCGGSYNVVKYHRNTVHGFFKNPADAAAFALRWQWNS